METFTWQFVSTLRSNDGELCTYDEVKDWNFISFLVQAQEMFVAINC